MRKRAASIFTREDALLEAFVLADLLERDLFEVLATDLWLLGAEQIQQALPTGQLWSSNSFVSGAGGLRFKSPTDQIGRSFDNGSPPLQRFFQRSCAARRNDAEMGPPNSLHASA